jgi:hypothetical protein
MRITQSISRKYIYREGQDSTVIGKGDGLGVEAEK